MGIAAAVGLYIQFLRIRKERRDQRTLDENAEREIQKQLMDLYQMKQQEAVIHFSSLSKSMDQKPPLRLLWASIERHLASFPTEANILFKKFEKNFLIHDASVFALVQHRYGKSLAAEGRFKAAMAKFGHTMTCSDIPPLIRAQAARECCNVVTQVAWDKPTDQARWDTVKKTVAYLTDTLGELRNYKPRNNERNNIRFLHASADEFQVLADARGRLTSEALSDVRNSIDRQIKFSPITGRNRNTQLAAGYLRTGELETAIRLAVRFTNEMNDPLERGLTQLVKGQGLLLKGKKTEAGKCIAAACGDFDKTSTLRFRRVLSIFRVNLDPGKHNLKQKILYLWPFRGPPRHVGAFVPHIPWVQA